MDWKTVLTTIAPTVLSATLGPAGAMAVEAIGKIIGIDAPTQDKIAKALTAGQLTPDQIYQLKTLELQYQNDERERGFKYAELEFKNQDSARQMQIATHSKMPAVLTVMVTIGFFGTLTLLFFNPELKSNDIMLIMVGQLSAVWAGCVAFYTGTTYQSANKNAALSNAAAGGK